MPAHSSAFTSEPRFQKDIQGSIYNVPNGTAAPATAKDVHAPQIDEPYATRHQVITPFFNMNNMHFTSDGETATFVRPAHFLVRPSFRSSVPGPIVPLIPLDLLPEFVEIVGIPRHLHPDMTVGMFNAGVLEKPGDFTYSMRFATPQSDFTRAQRGRHETQRTPSSDVTGGPDSSSTAGSDHSFSSVNVPRTEASRVSSADEDTAYPTRKAVHLRGNLTSQGPIDRASSRPRGDNGTTYRGKQIREPASSAERCKNGMNRNQHQKNDNQSQYGADDRGNGNSNVNGSSMTDNSASTKGRSFCRHFCHHGTCKWGLACRYQHAMPMTLEGLQELGLNDWPAWFRAEMRLAFARQAGAADHFGFGSGLGLSPVNVQSDGTAGNSNLAAAMATMVGQDQSHHRRLHSHYHPVGVGAARQVPVVNEKSGSMIGLAPMDKRVPSGSKPPSAGDRKKKEKEKRKEERMETGRAEKVKATKAVKTPTAQSGAAVGAGAVVSAAAKGTLEHRKGAGQGEEEKQEEEEEEKMMLVDIR